MIKTSKKSVAVFILIAMLIALLPHSSMALESENLIFDMDLSEYTDENPVVKSAAGGSQEITVLGTPKLGTTESGQKYLTFDNLKGTANNAASDAKTGIKVVDDLFMNQEAMTVEALVRGNNFGKKPNDRYRNYLFHGPSMQVHIYDTAANSILCWDPAGDKGDAFRLKQGEMQQFNDQWTHFVFTKAYDSEAGKWVGNLYIDGEKIKTAEYTAAFATSTNNILIIGNSNDIERSFDGDIASFKVYNSELTDDKVKEKYEDSLYGGNDTERLIFDMDLSEYADENPVVKSATGGSHEITVLGAPKLGTTEKGQKYLTFDNLKGTANNADSDAKVGIRVVDDLFMNQKAMTVETLVRGNNFGKKPNDRYRNYLFQGPNMQTYVYDSTANSILFWDPAGDKGDAFRLKQGEMQQFNDKWTHFVFTKAYDSEAGKWVGNLYIDGEKIKTAEYAAAFANSTSNVLMIGISNDLERSFDGDIATFKVYNTELTEEQIKAKYEEVKPEENQPEGGGSEGGQPDEDEPGAEMPDGIIAEEDFTKYEVGTHPDTDMYVSSAGVPGSNIDITVREEKNTDKTETIKYFEIGVDNESLDTFYGYQFPAPVNYDIAFDTNIRLINAAPSRGIRRAVSSNNSDTVHSMTGTGIDAKKDEFGFYNLRYIFTVGADGKYTVSWHDLLDGGRTIGSVSTEFTTISAVLFQQWVEKANLNTGVYMHVSKYKLMAYKTPEVVETNGSSLERGAEQLAFVLSEDIDENTITADSIKLVKSGTDEAVSVAFEKYDTDTKTVTLGLNEYLPYDTSFDICLSGIANLYGFEAKEGNKFTFKTKASAVTVSDFAFLSSDGESIDALGANANVSVKMKVEYEGNDESSLKVFLALYDEAEIIREIKAAIVNLSNPDPDISLALTDGIVPEEGYSVKCFVWETNAQNQIPVFSNAKVLK